MRKHGMSDSGTEYHLALIFQPLLVERSIVDVETLDGPLVGVLLLK